MNPERWERIKDLLNEAVAVDPGQRRSFLDRACDGDSTLRDEVETLLSAHDQAATDFLNVPAADLRAGHTPAPSRVGRRIGAYRILQEIGHGGMGEVYRAGRADGQYDKEVAIKLVRGGYDVASVLERFRHERQILASLDHANIARLLDGGTADDGTPYLVMELIEGVRIDAYCQDHKLSVTQRLELFCMVCGAVQYAHQRLVIHRDIKPSNVLVTDEGMPKLLDFGIAKLLDASAAGETTLARPMTPEYASPEQIRGETISTASDVYSLGVLLFQLLTGRSPYSVNSNTPAELARAITEVEPQRPSTAVIKSKIGEPREKALEAGWEFSHTTSEGSPAKLQRRLLGDIDNILLKALRKEPQRRYASVEQFADDIHRHLKGLPVLAAKDSWNYRARKFIQRHRVGVLAAGVALIALIVGAGAIVREARIATANQRKAEQRFDDVRKLANSLVFDVNDAMADLPGNTAARKVLLDHAVEYLDKLSQDANGNIDLQRELAWAYQRLASVQGSANVSNVGEVDASIVSTHKAFALFDTVAKANPNDTHDQLNLATTLFQMAFADLYYPEGRPEIDKAIAITEQLMRTDGKNIEVRRERAREYVLLGYSQGIVGDRVQSVDSLRQGLTLLQGIKSSDPGTAKINDSIAEALVQLGPALAATGNLDEAQQQGEAGMEAYQSMVKPGVSPDLIRLLARSRDRLAWVYIMRNNPRAARQNFDLMRSAIAPLAQVDPKNSVLQLDMINLTFEEGRLDIVTGRPAEGAAKIQQAIDQFEKMKTEEEIISVGTLWSWLGEAQFQTRNYGAALQSLKKAAESLEKEPKYADGRCGIATCYARIGDIYAKLNREQEAADAYRKAISTADLSFALSHKDTPAFYPLAIADAGLGDLSTAQAGKTRDPKERARMWKEACTSYQNGSDAWSQIPHPALFSPSQYPADNPRRASDGLSRTLSALNEIDSSGAGRNRCP